MESKPLTVRVDADTFERTMELLGELGLTATVAVNVFFKQMLYENGFPFPIRRERPNAETIAAFDQP
jgi:DNA-damage-inducible protein J